ncbi:hypothetical protein CANCADRAFT_86893 [Tortispora caseinolytica NRRL Y-17796]|uniref:GPI-anchored wall transfer protein n=1 Tax=Tortispora caseinolytica NRRL Y-17796 TaxID=767744 RepID=A0A1E4TL09_9ASCO|nr:hypothetical protein CANCADRAFT_86893 [Tortispora caseinolytica NRRL Y-17796]
MSKTEKEAFVSDQLGGSINEINLIVSISSICYGTWSILSNKSVFKGYEIVAEYVYNVLCMILAMTIYANQPFLLIAIIVGTLVFGIGSPSKPTKRQISTQKSFLTIYRAQMMILTCIAILAVDFPAFPRRFAKVETWGTSLMDLGVGSFVYSMGVVSSKNVSSRPFLSELFQALKQSALMLILGLIRLFAVKYFDYQEHVTEYGVHWNFFITLGLLPIITVFVLKPSKYIPLSVIAISLAISYEMLLDIYNLSSIVLSSNRSNIFLANKEGLSSFIGYAVIFFLGKSLGYIIMPSKINRSSLIYKPKTKTPQKLLETVPSSFKLLIVNLTIRSAIYTLLYLYFTRVIDLQVSRRLANLPYILWIAAFNCSQIASFAAVEHYAGMYKVPKILQAVNYNGLAVFLVANILTGLINMTIDTIHQPDYIAVLILTVYTATLSALALFLYSRRIRIKL